MRRSKTETKIEMAYFFNDLASEENHRLQGWMNDFEIQVAQMKILERKIIL